MSRSISLVALLWVGGCGVTVAPNGTGNSTLPSGGVGVTAGGSGSGSGGGSGTGSGTSLGTCAAPSSAINISLRADTYNVATFPGADASICINACLTALSQIGGGVCDASSLGGTQTMSQEIELGSSAAGSIPASLTLTLPDTATWSWHLTDGKSCGIRQYARTALLGNQPGGAGNRMILTASAGATMDSLYCTDDRSGAVTFVRAEGFAAWNGSAANRFASGLIDLRNVGAVAAFTRIYAENDYGDAWHVSSACCGTQVNNVEGVSGGSGITQGVPLTIGPGIVGAVSFAGSSFNAPALGAPNILIQGGPATMGVQFIGVHMVGSGATTHNGPMVYIGAQVGPIHFLGGLAELDLQDGLPSGNVAIFENHGYKLSVAGLEVTGSLVGVDDVTAGVKVPVRLLDADLGEISSYTTIP